MTRRAFDLTLYLVTDPLLVGGRRLADVTAAAVDGGVTLVQLRDKTAATGDLIRTAGRLLDVLRPRGVKLLVNDRVDVALASGAAGVHLGQSDMPPATARRLLGEDAVIGLSITHPDELASADPAVIDYLGVGPVFATTTKGDASPPLDDAAIRRIVAGTGLPTVGIGGITAANAARPRMLGLGGVAVVSAICAAADPAAAARALRAAMK